MAEQAKRNTPSSQAIKDSVSRIEQCQRDLLAERGAFMRRCRTIRESIAAVYDESKEKGIQKKELRALVKQRGHERKAQEVRLNLEADERDHFDMLKEKLGDFANTPLGAAALTTQQGDVLDRLHA
jgi:hypothetical protein